MRRFLWQQPDLAPGTFQFSADLITEGLKVQIVTCSVCAGDVELVEGDYSDEQTPQLQSVIYKHCKGGADHVVTRAKLRRAG